MMQTMLTTKDNPYNPFDSYNDWYAWDAKHGYHTPSFLARVVVTSQELSEADQALAIDQAIDEIVDHDVTGMFVLVTKEVSDSEEDLMEGGGGS